MDSFDGSLPERIDGPDDTIDEWEVVTTERCGRRHVVFLSAREEDHHKATFIVAEADAVCDLLDRR